MGETHWILSVVGRYREELARSTAWRLEPRARAPLVEHAADDESYSEVPAPGLRPRDCTRFGTGVAGPSGSEQANRPMLVGSG
jgi:hypothetical protein